MNKRGIRNCVSNRYNLLLKPNRSQITIFIIIAIVIVVVIAAYFVIRGDLSFSSNKAANDVPGFVNDCLSKAITESIYLNSLQGGYFVVPDNKSVQYQYLSIPIYWKNGKQNVFPSQRDLEVQLEWAAQNRLANCLDNLSEFQKQGYETNMQDIQNISVKINAKSVSADLVLPIFVKKADATEEYSSFSQTVNFNLLDKYNIVKQAMTLQASIPKDAPISQFSELAFDHDFTFEMINLDNTTILYAFEFPEKIKDINYKYAFVSQY